MNYQTSCSFRRRTQDAFINFALAMTSIIMLVFQHAQAEETEELKQELVSHWNQHIANLTVTDNDSANEQNKSNDILTTLNTDSYFELADTDCNRGICVGGLQYSGEHVLLNQLKKKPSLSATVFFITDRPVSPLCNQSGTVNDDTLAPNNRASTHIRDAVSKRTETVRLLLEYAKTHQSQLTLYFIYTDTGYQQRTSSEIAVFETIKNNAEAFNNIYFHMTDQPIDSTIINGASYLLSTQKNQHLLWSLIGKQAIHDVETNNQTCWKFWLGSTTDMTSEQSAGKRWQAIQECCKKLNISIKMAASE